MTQQKNIINRVNLYAKTCCKVPDYRFKTTLGYKNHVENFLQPTSHT